MKVRKGRGWKAVCGSSASVRYNINILFIKKISGRAWSLSCCGACSDDVPAFMFSPVFKAP